MSQAKRVERPLSPHLQIYRWHIPMLTSILTRVTGHALVAGVMLGVAWLFSATISDEAFETMNSIATCWFGDLVFTGTAWAVWYHLLAGVRHLYYDAGKGLDIPTAEKLGWGVIIGSVVLTVLTILAV
jgi:succinate dehydrogenase / fumarate reductase cytochrome b subunit